MRIKCMKQIFYRRISRGSVAIKYLEWLRPLYNTLFSLYLIIL